MAIDSSTLAQNPLFQVGSYTCIGLCMASPENRARSPLDSSQQTWCPAVWPVAISMWNTSSRSMSPSQSWASPRSNTGRTESSKTPALYSRPAWFGLVSGFQKSNSVLLNRCLALGNVGTHSPSTSVVFQPTWSRWRWVQIT